MAFHFEEPPGFNFKPGQSADLTLTDPAWQLLRSHGMHAGIALQRKEYHNDFHCSCESIAL